MKATVGGVGAEEGRHKSALLEARARKTSSRATVPMQNTQHQPTDAPKAVDGYSYVRVSPPIALCLQPRLHRPATSILDPDQLDLTTVTIVTSDPSVKAMGSLDCFSSRARVDADRHRPSRPEDWVGGYNF
jgi:hypothetical protein